MNGTFERKTITVPYAPDILKIGRQTNAKSLPTPNNGYFDSKVLSRQHAEVWADQDGKIWIRDVRSSNGTFVNGKRLSMENRDSEPHPIKEQDVLELGIDIVSEDGKSIVHSKVAARVEHAGVIGGGSLDMNVAADLNGVNGMGPQISPGLRSRPSSQGSISSSRFSNAPSNGVAAYHAKWLQPVTMEQIAKKLNVELRQARLQSQDLHHTNDFVNAVVSHQHPLPIPEPQKIQSPFKASESKARFSDPPGPPPSQPLPEKPDALLRSKLAELPALLPLLQRSETEKPILGSADSPIKLDPSLHINDLVEALSTAQRERTSLSEQVKILDENLRLEKEARIFAEQRAESLSGNSTPNNGNFPVHATKDADEPPTHMAHSAETAARLQERCDLMKAEMESMRAQMENFRQRAESAERASEKDRQSLSEMVSSIRRRDDAAKRRKESHRGKDEDQTDNTDDDDATREKGYHTSTDPDDDDVETVERELNGHVNEVLQRQSTLKPSHESQSSDTIPLAMSAQLKDMSAVQLDEISKTVATLRSSLERQRLDPRTGTIGSRRQEQLVQSAPYASVLGVVILGMGLMAYLNNWQKVANR